MNNRVAAVVVSAITLAWRLAWRPPERRPIYEFAAEQIEFGAESPFPGKFRVDNTPFIRTPLDMLRRDEFEIVSLSGVAQSAKSTAGSLFAADCVLHNPGSFTWNSPTKDAAKKTAEKKIWPIFRRCRAIFAKIPPKSGFLTIRFADAPFYVQTASEGNSHGDTVRYQVNDDLHIWPLGMLEKFMKRTSAFARAGRKILNLSTGQNKTHEEKQPDGTLVERGCDAFEDWMKGTRSLWSVRCPKCTLVQPLAWQHRGADGKPIRDFNGKPVYGIVWEASERTQPGGRWNWKEVAKTARWRCCKLGCGHELADLRSNRRALNMPANGAGYVDTNPHPEPGHWSGRYPAMASELISWGELVVEFLFALECLAVGNVTKLQEFVMNRLAEPFFAGESTETDTAASADYSLGDDWLDPETGEPLADRTFLVVDTQEENGRHFKVLARTFAKTGASRLAGYWSRKEAIEEVRALQLELGIPDARVLMDVGDGNRVVENYEIVARYGWTGLKGSAAPGFEHLVGRMARKVIKAFSKKFYGDPSVGKKRGRPAKAQARAAAQARGGLRPAGLALCFHWSNPLIKDMLARLRAGQGIYWGRPSDECEEYTDGLHSEIKVQELDRRTGRPRWRWKPIKKNNHPWDLECMALVAAIMSGILAPPQPPPEPDSVDSPA